MEKLEANSYLARRAFETDGEELACIMGECGDYLDDDRYLSMSGVSEEIVNAVCDLLEEKTDNHIEQILVGASLALSMTANVLAWIDELNLRAEIDQIEKGM